MVDSHGPYELTWDDFLSLNEDGSGTRRGCPHCRNKKYSKTALMEKLLSVWENKLDLSLVNSTELQDYVEVKCLAHNHKFSQQLRYVEQGKIGCDFCLRLSLEQFIEKAKSVHGSKYDYSPVSYLNNETTISINCPKHGIFKVKPRNHLSGNGCKFCGFESMAITKSMKLSEFLSRAKKVHNNEFEYKINKFVNASTKIELTHKVCNTEFTQSALNHLKGFGCPFCSSSKGEHAVAVILRKLKIPFTQQVRFDDCRNTNPLPFDFVIYNDNLKQDLKFIIEFDGIQHFEPVTFGGISLEEAQKLFEYTQENDKIKMEYCRNKNILMHRIPYWEADGRLPQLIKNLFNTQI